MEGEIGDKDQIEALARMGNAISADRYMNGILRLMTAPTVETMGPGICELWLLAEDGKTLSLRGTLEKTRGIRSVSVGQGITGKVALTRETVAVRDVWENFDAVAGELPDNKSLVSLLSLPLIAKERLVGVINYYTPYAHDFSETEKRVLRNVMGAAAEAIGNSESMARTPIIREELDSRKIIEWAKVVLVKRRGISGENAYEWIQRRSQDTRKSVREVATAVLLTEETPSHVPV